MELGSRINPLALRPESGGVEYMYGGQGNENWYGCMGCFYRCNSSMRIIRRALDSLGRRLVVSSQSFVLSN